VPEFVRVEHCPDASDLVTSDLERVHGQSAAVLLSHQTGLAVHLALQNQSRVGRYPARYRDEEVSDLFGTFDRLERRASVAGERGTGIEQPMMASMSLASKASLKSRTARSCWATGVAGGCATRTRWRADDASWRHAAEVRPVISHLAEGVTEDVEDQRDAFGGVMDSSMTKNAMPADVMKERSVAPA
jgi:hypothetical protein